MVKNKPFLFSSKVATIPSDLACSINEMIKFSGKKGVTVFELNSNMKLYLLLYF